MLDWIRDLDFTDGWGAVGAALAALALIAAGVGRLWQWFRRSAVDSDDQALARGFVESLKPTNWEITRGRGQLYLLRNLGPIPVTGVEMDEDRIACITRQMPNKVNLDVNEAHEFMLIGTMQTGGAPPQIWVRTTQEPNWTPVPTP